MTDFSFRQKMELMQLIVSERSDRVVQMRAASRKTGRYTDSAIKLQADRIPILESILRDYQRAVARGEKT
jgi:hypothetical protein